MTARQAEGEDLQRLAIRSELLALRLAAEFPAAVLARLLAIEVMSACAASGRAGAIVALEERLCLERAKAWKALLAERSEAAIASVADIEARRIARWRGQP